MTDRSYDPKAFLGVGWGFPVEVRHAGILLAEHEEDIAQAIRIVLGTEQGERIMRPEFGVALRRMIFTPIGTTTLAMIRKTVEDAIIRWEPRVDLRNVSASVDRSAIGRVNVDLEYVVRSTNTFYNLVYPFYLREAHP